MANQFVNLPAPAANGAGAGVDCTTMGRYKTIVVSGSWSFPPNVTIEINNDAAQAGSWSAIGSTQGGGIVNVEVACQWIRARVSAFKGGQAPDVNLGTTDDGTLFAALVAPAADGIGASVDVSALGLFKTVQVGGAFRGAAIIEISEDGGVTWSQPASFLQPGLVTSIIAARYMRVRRQGVPQNSPGLPIVNVAATDVGGGGGGASTDQEFRYVATGAEASQFTVTLPAARDSANYNVQLTSGGPLANAFKDARALVSTFTVNDFDVEMAVAPEAGDILMISVKDLT